MPRSASASSDGIAARPTASGPVWRVLAEHAPGIAPRPLRREVEEGAPVIVMERLPGDPLGRAPLSSAQTAELGRALRKVYAVPVAAVRDRGIGERALGPRELPGALREWLSGPTNVAACEDPPLVESALRQAATWLQDAALPGPRVDTLSIADLNPSNVLWDGETCRLVDFEDGGLSEVAFELADHAEHLAGRLTAVFDVDALVDAVGLARDERIRMAFAPPSIAKPAQNLSLSPVPSDPRRNVSPSATVSALGLGHPLLLAEPRHGDPLLSSVRSHHISRAYPKCRTRLWNRDDALCLIPRSGGARPCGRPRGAGPRRRSARAA